jgi:5'-nucleotidase
MPNRPALIAGLALVAVTVAGPATVASAAKKPKAKAPLRVLVTNDDGVKAPGIDAIVNALRKRKDVKVTVVAPAANQSGTGGKTTAVAATKLPAKRTTTKSGVAAWAVTGYPADSVRYALAKVVKARNVDLLVSGINQGANLGPFVDLSGTVGAARAAAQAGIPALATSEGTPTTTAFAAGVTSTMAWLAANRTHLRKGTVQNLNIPDCSAGKVRGTKKVESLATLPAGVNPFVRVDCTQTASAGANDVTAYQAGFAPLTKIPKKPAA